MCQPYPKGRCSTDARKRLSSCQAELRKAEVAFTSDPNGVNQAVYEKARADLIQAQISYDGTDTGREKAEARVRSTDEAGRARAEASLTASVELRQTLNNAAEKLSEKYLSVIPEGDEEGRKAYKQYAKSLMYYQECMHAVKVAPELEHVFRARIADLKKEAGDNYSLLKTAYEKAHATQEKPMNPEPVVVQADPAVAPVAPVVEQPVEKTPRPTSIPTPPTSPNKLLVDIGHAQGTLAACKRALDDARSPDERQRAEDALKAARIAHEQALVAYVASPQGEAEMKQTVRLLRGQGKPVRKQEMLLERANAYKIAQRRRSEGGGRISLPRRSSIDGTRIKTRVPELSGCTAVMQEHALKQAAEKGFAEDTIKKTLENPAEVYPSGSHPGQWRVTGNGICLVGEPVGDRFRIITMYADRVVTAPRADQLSDEKGRIFAQRYAQGVGRGGGQGSAARSFR